MPAQGPAPNNTLVYLECDLNAASFGNPPLGKLLQWGIRFKTAFEISGYQQNMHSWYLETMHVSATAMLRVVKGSADNQFTFAVDQIDHFLDDDGHLGFRVCYGIQKSSAPTLLTGLCSAWVLLYEPKPQLPPTGNERPHWPFLPDSRLLRPAGSLGDRDLRPWD